MIAISCLDKYTITQPQRIALSMHLRGKAVFQAAPVSMFLMLPLDLFCDLLSLQLQRQQGDKIPAAWFQSWKGSKKPQQNNVPGCCQLMVVTHSKTFTRTWAQGCKWNNSHCLLPHHQFLSYQVGHFCLQSDKCLFRGHWNGGSLYSIYTYGVFKAASKDRFQHCIFIVFWCNKS